MASEETRRALKLFGVAVTDLEEAVERGAPAEEVARLDAVLTERLREITALVDRLRSRRRA
ncbi:MAG TPA: hypothetical protein VNK50_06040 [Calidithermus sp.]|nr:hypothetical protein [Calidithermus sp.]